MDDDRAERLLSRRGRTSAGAHDPAGAFVAAVADLGCAEPVPTGALAALLADGFVPAAGRVSTPVEQSPGRRSWLADLPLRARVLAASGVALIGLATAATAGVLPGPVQEGVGGVLEAVTPFDFPSPGDPAAPVPQDDPNGGDTGDRSPVPAGPADPPAADLQVPQPLPQPLPAPPVPDLVPSPVTPPVPVQDSASTAPGPPRAGTPPPQAPGPPVDVPGQDIAPRRAQPPAGLQQGDTPTLSGRSAVAPAAVTAADPGAGRPAG